MNTVFLLMAEYEKAVLPLDEICESYFGCTPKVAARKAASCELPIPAFRQGNTQKSKWAVHVHDLAAFIDTQRQVASSNWQRVNG
ncbi:pyocin activator PrtN family protein [Paraferrimonas haliotis]|uniref:Pyocin activator protein PrtN n=1 Tax=Paraferrimonas haliotis TaxID=2013866 RepID=A0AA37TKN7_9GAMM|nr:pyocin activator PrtN family protein [Paraferrimonas haliotis]GLS83257.1 hypothetical protein GCM10007894_12340 [Paraferrimonas haliotis]